MTTMSFGSQSILVIKDRMSGFIAAKLTKDKSTKEAIEALKTWFNSYGFASVVRSDGGPSFRESFSEELDRMGVKHVLSSSYYPQSNGGAERVVRSFCEVLEKRGQRRTSQLELSEICFRVNCITQPSGRGSAAERFLKRRPKTLLPGSMEAHVDHQEMVKKVMSISSTSTRRREELPSTNLNKVTELSSKAQTVENGWKQGQYRRRELLTTTPTTPLRSRWTMEA